MDKIETQAGSIAEVKAESRNPKETQFTAAPLEAAGVTISAERYAELIRAEQNCQIIRRVFDQYSLFEFSDDKEKVISLLLGTKVRRHE